MSANLPNEYQNNFDANKNYFKSLHFAGKGLAAYEVNEVFDMQDNKRLELAKAVFKEGDITFSDVWTVAISCGDSAQECRSIVRCVGRLCHCLDFDCGRCEIS